MLREHPPGARALDLACGGGRNTLYLAELRYAVDAWDISDVGLDLLRSELACRAAAGKALAVSPFRVDFEEVPLPPIPMTLSSTRTTSSDRSSRA